MSPSEGSSIEYLSEVRRFVHEEGFNLERLLSSPDFLESFSQRDRYVGRFAWAIPNEAALTALKQLGPLVEIGAGNGYWAHLLQERGAIVRPYDRHPPQHKANHYHPDEHVWTRVYVGGPEKAAKHPNHALLLCWPPLHNPMAENALQHYAGSTVAYIGEWGGCTANDAFHSTLEKEWRQISRISIPNWPGIRDTLTIWKRQPKRASKIRRPPKTRK